MCAFFWHCSSKKSLIRNMSGVFSVNTTLGNFMAVYGYTTFFTYVFTSLFSFINQNQTKWKWHSHKVNKIKWKIIPNGTSVLLIKMYSIILVSLVLANPFVFSEFITGKSDLHTIDIQWLRSKQSFSRTFEFIFHTQDLSVIQILREINFENLEVLKLSILPILGALNLLI